MASGGPSMFVEEDDSDVNTTTTEEDYDPDKEYDVECVLSEQQGEDGQMYYLIKWEGYALYDCTWETKQSITSDVVLRHWEADKRLIKSGEKQPFDVDDYDRAFEEHAEEQERKRKLRKKKRKERGKAVTSSDDDSDSTSSYDLPTTATPKRTRMKVVASPVKKKGIAQPVTKRRNTFSQGTNLSSEDSRPAPQHSDVDSLFGEPIEKSVVPTPPKAKGITSAPTTSNNKQTTITKKSGEQPTVNAAKSNSTVPKPASTPPPEQRKPSASSTTTAATSARKTAPTGTVGRAKPASKSGTNVFADWTKAKKPRQRPRVRGETEKDSMDPKFTRLAIQNRYQKYSRNEPAPNPDDLVMIDPKTGRTTQPAKVKAPTRPPPPRSGTGPEDIHSAVGRGRSPPRNRQRTPTPPSSPRQRQLNVQTTADPTPASDVVTNPGLNDSGIGRKQNRYRTCWHWREGNCRFTSDTCWFLHAEVPTEVTLASNPAKRNKTCHFWATRGKCNLSDEECEFCHFWTTETAAPPGTYQANRRNSVVASGRTESNDGQVRFVSPIEQLATPLSPVAQFATTTPAVTQTAPPVQLDKAPHAPAPEPIADPRLRGRTARVSDISATASEERRVAEPVRHTDEASPANGGDVEMTDAMDISHGSLEQDIAMAQQGLPGLDPAKMLTYISTTDNEKTVDIQHVYIHMPDRPQELEILRKYFTRLNRQVYTSRDIGAWSLFTKKYVKRCLLIVHPTELFTGTIPGLYDFLVNHGSGFSVFSIGVQHARCIRENRKPAFEAQRIFPHGTLTFISDDVFVYYPEQATQIIEDFLAAREYEPKAGSLSKIGARVGIKEWLLRLASKKMEEHSGDGAAGAYVQLYSAICRLCPLADEDPSYPGQHVPLESSYLWSPPADCLPSLQGRWESGDEEGATDYLANFFAGEACGKAWKYRKFRFVYQRPDDGEQMTDSQSNEDEEADRDPRGWGKRYSHIGVVKPESLLKKSKA